MALIEEIKNKPVNINIGTRGRALETGKTVKSIISESPSGFTGALLKKESLKSIVTVPLKAKDEIIGVMQLASKKEERFSEADINLLDLIGNHLGISINNLNLYETINIQLKQLEKKNIKLTELEHMKTNLIQMIVHDLKNPLMGIMGYIEILLEDEKSYSDSQVNAIKMIYISSKDLMRMILNLLDISRMEEQRITLKLDEVNLKDLINKNIYEVKSMTVRENKTIKLEFPEKLPIIKADRDLIYRVIANLLNNAIKYSPPGGNITIGIYHGDTGHWLTVYIADEGQGISKDYQNKIFQKFYQIEAKSRNIENFRTSRGLGLTFCKLAVDAHGGRIWVESDVGRGSKFCFNIPFIYFPDEKV
jgi:K+-sensing histidine kinase KdpD